MGIFGDDPDLVEATNMFIASLYGGGVVAYITNQQGVVNLGLSEVVYTLLALFIMVAWWKIGPYLLGTKDLNWNFLNHQHQTQFESPEPGDDALPRYRHLAELYKKERN